MDRNEQLIRERERRGWSQRRVAIEIGTDEKRVGEWERGTHVPSPHFQEKLCQLFSKDAQELGFVEHTESRIIVPSGLWADDLLSTYSQGVLALHDLYFRGNPYQVEAILPLYRSQTAALVHPGPLSVAAARIASMAEQLACELATDREDFGAAQQSAQQALHYAQIANDRSLQVASLIGQANIGFHRKHSTTALHAYQQAISLFDDTVTPLLKGRTYAGIAEVYAMRQQTQEALRAMGLAYEHYPMKPEDDPAYPYLHASRYSLYVFGDTQSRLFLSQPKEADAALIALNKEQNTDVENEPVTKLDLLYYQAESYQQQGELEPASAALLEGGMLAKELGSRLYFGKLVDTYEAVRAKWPHERQVCSLAEVFQS